MDWYAVAEENVTVGFVCVKWKNLANTMGHYASAMTGYVTPMMDKFAEDTERVTVESANVILAGLEKPVNTQLLVTWHESKATRCAKILKESFVQMQEPAIVEDVNVRTQKIMD